MIPFGQIAAITAEEAKYRLAVVEYRLGAGRQNDPPVVIVNGPPKTGTTWMLRLIAAIPGFHHGGNLRGAINHYAAASAGSVFHSHDPYSDRLAAILAPMHVAVVAMIRDPRDRVVSEMFHIRRVPEHPWHAAFAELDDHDALMACIEGIQPDDDRLPLGSAAWSTGHHMAWMAVGELYVLTVRYEDLLRDSDGVFSRVVDHVGAAAHGRLTNAIVSRTRFERLTVGKSIWRPMRRPGEADPDSHYRSGVAGGWRDFFAGAHIDAFKRVAGEELVLLGYEKALDW